jgi:N-acetylmuramoyl-L-alanine amidase
MKQQIFIPILISAVIFIGSYLLQAAKINSQENNYAAIKTSESSLTAMPKIGKVANNILVVYPQDNSTINAPSTFLIGSIENGNTLTCNGQVVKLNKNNFFAHKVSLKAGINNFILTKDDSSQLTLTVKKPIYQLAIRSFPPTINAKSLRPHEDIGLGVSDTLELAMHASSDGQASVKIGKRTIKLIETQNKGKKSGLYKGFYRITYADNWQDEQPLYTLTKSDQKISTKSEHKISTIQQPLFGVTTNDNTIVRFAPDLARSTPLPIGVHLVIDGWTGKYWRIELCHNQHVYILKEDIRLNSDGDNSIANEPIKTVNIDSAETEEKILIPLTKRLPFQIEQQITPNKLKLKIFRATADTDWITNESKDNKISSKNSETIDYLTWGQPSDCLYQLTVNLKAKQQWGFWADYENTNLILHIRKSPPLDTSNKNLKGLIICIDPGHGGKETGSIGCSGIRESEINLAIAQKLKAYLEQEKANVIMTRTNNAFDLALAKRVEIARNAKAHIIISIHNNALPDGRDPLIEHGTSTYWYHPQSIVLARQLRESLIRSLSFKDHGTLYQNLALCRPSDMLACLVEVGFMINPDEYASLIQPEYQDKAALSIAHGIKTFLAKSENINE